MEAATENHIGRVPREVFHRLGSVERVAFLDSSADYPRAPFGHLTWAPVRELRVECDGVVRVDGERSGRAPLPEIDRFLEQESQGGRTVIGALGYELRHWTAPRSGPLAPLELPIVALASYPTVHSFDYRRGTWGEAPPDLLGRRRGSARVGRPETRCDRSTYRSLFERLHEWIVAGDVYQANLSIRFDAALEGDPASFYERLSALSPAPYGAYVDFGDFQLLSISPELFLARRADRLSTRPIKGTRRRGLSPLEDERLLAELRAHPKDRAEHIMIVDLERNDLGRIAATGSVSVDELETVESYPTLHHMESSISASVRPALPFSEILRATFPGGSITGAPKIRAMQILAELEPSGRGFYTGSILYYPPSGDFTLSLAIRTATVHRGRIHYTAGSGVVADSTADGEYEECFLKAAALFRAAETQP